MATGAGTGTPASNTLTYSDMLSTDLDRVRFYLQDTVAGAGPKPADGNFTDAEITALIATEGTWQLAVAGGFETLASAWRRYPNFTADGLTLNRTAIADGYAKQASEWRAKAGPSKSYARAGSRAPTRVDGYSSDVDSQAV